MWLCETVVLFVVLRSQLCMCAVIIANTAKVVCLHLYTHVHAFASLYIFALPSVSNDKMVSIDCTNVTVTTTLVFDLKASCVRQICV